MKCHGQIGKTIYEAQPCPEPVVWEVILLDKKVQYWCEKHGSPLRSFAHPKVKWTRIDQEKAVNE